MPTDLPDTRLHGNRGSYQLVSQLTATAACRLYNARDARGRPYRLWRYSTARPISAHALAATLDRASSIKSPHLLTTADGDLLDSQPWFVRRHLPLPTLERIVGESGALSAEQACLLGAQLAVGLGRLHANEFGCRPSPKRILMDCDGPWLTHSAWSVDAKRHLVAAAAPSREDLVGLARTLWFAVTGHAPMVSDPVPHRPEPIPFHENPARYQIVEDTLGRYAELTATHRGFSAMAREYLDHAHAKAWQVYRSAVRYPDGTAPPEHGPLETLSVSPPGRVRSQTHAAARRKRRALPSWKGMLALVALSVLAFAGYGLWTSGLKLNAEAGDCVTVDSPRKVDCGVANAYMVMAAVDLDHLPQDREERAGLCAPADYFEATLGVALPDSKRVRLLCLVPADSAYFVPVGSCASNDGKSRSDCDREGAWKVTFLADVAGRQASDEEQRRLCDAAPVDSTPKMFSTSVGDSSRVVCMVSAASPHFADVGMCLGGDLKKIGQITPCDSASKVWKVVGRYPAAAKTAANGRECAKDHPGSYWFWTGKGDRGWVVCLKPE